ncbi:MAG: ABC transporter permease [Methanoculleus sp.]
MRHSGIAGQLRRATVVAKKNILIYYIKGPVVIFGLLIPLFLFLAFMVGNRFASLPFLISGLLAMTLFFTATAVSPVIFPWEAQARTLERLAAAPISIPALVFGDILASFVFGAGITLVPVGIALALGMSVSHPVALALGILIGAVCFSALGTLLSVPPTNSPPNIMMLSSLIKFPLIFISGIFIPIETLPAWGRTIASLSPLTYFADIARYSLGEANTFPIIVDIAALALFAAVFLVASMKLHERTLPGRI